MATTSPRTWGNDVQFSTKMVEEITDGYRAALGDADKASQADDAAYYEGTADTLAWVLDMIHGEI